jgi:PhzF family phenazine biosynthesis protein
MQIRELKCFGERSGDGNPALVIEGDRSGEAGRRAFARSRNVTCVFVDAGDESCSCVLDYFYPHTRSPLCLHATLAAAWVLFERQGSGAAITVKTALRGQALSLSRDGAELFVKLARQDVPQVDVKPGLPARLLAAPGLAPASAPVLASVGSPKLLVEVKDAASLYGLRPDLALIVEWGKANGVSGCYVYCRLGDGRYEGRNFNHLDPALEDSATGVAAGSLTALLGHGITLLQGRAAGNACLIRTRVDGDAILIGGKAEPLQTQPGASKLEFSL